MVDGCGVGGALESRPVYYPTQTPASKAHSYISLARLTCLMGEQKYLSSPLFLVCLMHIPIYPFIVHTQQLIYICMPIDKKKLTEWLRNIQRQKWPDLQSIV